MRKHGWQGALLTKGHSLDDFTYVKCPGQGATEAECRLVVARTGVGAGGGRQKHCREDGGEEG